MSLSRFCCSAMNNKKKVSVNVVIAVKSIKNLFRLFFILLSLFLFSFVKYRTTFSEKIASQDRTSIFVSFQALEIFENKWNVGFCSWKSIVTRDVKYMDAHNKQRWKTYRYNEDCFSPVQLRPNSREKARKKENNERSSRKRKIDT